jgi:hypothetical protein
MILVFRVSFPWACECAWNLKNRHRHNFIDSFFEYPPELMRIGLK